MFINFAPEVGVYAAVAFYSPIHGEEYVRRRFQEVVRHIPEVSGPFKSADETPAVRARALLAVTLTGGTGAAVAEYAERIGVKAVVTLGFPEHNSAASSLSARSYLEAEGVRVWPLHCAPGENCGDVAARARGIARAVALLTAPRVLLIGRRTAQADRFSAKFGGSVDVMELDRFAEIVERSPPDPEFLSVFGVTEVARIYGALKSLGGYDGKAISCFPYILKYGVTPCLALALANARGDVVACEGDLQALAGMLISKGLTGYSGWIANVVYAKSAEAFFAHCTAALNMAKSWRLMPHFETGRPYGLAASLAEGRYTAVSFGPAFDKLAVGVFDAVESGNLVDWACRTQLRAKPLFDGRRLFEAAPANHHVFIPGDRREEVRAVAYLLGVGLLEY
jgi:L-fucose isomerase-like protein